MQSSAVRLQASHRHDTLPCQLPATSNVPEQPLDGAIRRLTHRPSLPERLGGDLDGSDTFACGLCFQRRICQWVPDGVRNTASRTRVGIGDLKCVS